MFEIVLLSAFISEVAGFGGALLLSECLLKNLSDM